LLDGVRTRGDLARAVADALGGCSADEAGEGPGASRSVVKIELFVRELARLKQDRG